jgi:hypothetical protein
MTYGHFRVCLSCEITTKKDPNGGELPMMSHHLQRKERLDVRLRESDEGSAGCEEVRHVH